MAPFTSPEAPYLLGLLRLKLRFTLYLGVSLRLRRSSVNPNCDFCNGRCICPDVRPMLLTRIELGRSEHPPLIEERCRTDSKRRPRRRPKRSAIRSPASAARSIRRNWPRSRSDPLPLAAEDDHGGPAEIDVPGRLLAPRRPLPRPKTPPLLLPANPPGCGPGRPRGALRPRPRSCRLLPSPRLSVGPGSRFPVAPAASAERQIAPRLRGSWI